MESYRQLREEMEKVQASYKTLKEVEDMLHKTLIQAEQSSKDMLENARHRAELVVREAESKADEIMRTGVNDRKDLQQEIRDLVHRRDQVLVQLRVFLNQAKMAPISRPKRSSTSKKARSNRLPTVAATIYSTISFKICSPMTG